MKHHHYLFSIALTILVGCSSSTNDSVQLANDADLTANAKSIGLQLDNNFSQLQLSINALTSELSNNCSGTITEDSIILWQALWSQSMRHWQSLQDFTQGPLSTTRIIQVWPNANSLTKSDTMQSLMENDIPAINDDWLMGVNREFKGLQSLEFALFEASSNNTLVNSFNSNTRRCDFSKVVSAELKFWAEQIISEAPVANNRWQGEDGYYQNYLKPGGGDTLFSSAKDLQEDWLTDYVSGFENLKRYKLEEPLGWNEGACTSDSSGQYSAKADSVEAPFSGKSIELIFDKLKALKAYYDQGNNSYQKLLANKLSAPLAAAIDREFQAALSQESELTGIHLKDYINDHLNAETLPVDPTYQALLKFHRAIRNLTQLFKSELAGLMNITISFNATDGDSGRPSSLNCWPSNE